MLSAIDAQELKSYFPSPEYPDVKNYSVLGTVFQTQIYLVAYDRALLQWDNTAYFLYPILQYPLDVYRQKPNYRRCPSLSSGTANKDEGGLKCGGMII